jgi:hypothetical protein
MQNGKRKPCDEHHSGKVYIYIYVYSSFRHSSGRAAVASHYNSGKQFVSGTSQNLLAEAGFVLAREDY